MSAALNPAGPPPTILMLRGNLTLDVGSGVGNLQPQLIDCFRQLFSCAQTPVAIAQRIVSSCHPLEFLSGPNSRCFESFLTGTKALTAVCRAGWVISSSLTRKTNDAEVPGI
jgi:hypothetical protein